MNLIKLKFRIGERGNLKMERFRVYIYGGLLTFILGLIIGILIFGSYQTNSESCVTFFFGISFSGMFLYYAYNNTCPECKHVFVLQVTGKDVDDIHWEHKVREWTDSEGESHYEEYDVRHESGTEYLRCKNCDIELQRDYRRIS